MLSSSYFDDIESVLKQGQYWRVLVMDFGFDQLFGEGDSASFARICWEYLKRCFQFHMKLTQALNKGS